MIFVTVGTHEQQFNRLIEYVDKLKANKIITENVIMQTGYSTYVPKYCKWKKLFPYDEMINNVNNAKIVITHGGPSSFIMPLQAGKIPIVVPRRKEFNEHVNNHQLSFCREVANRQHNIIQIDDIQQLNEVIVNYNKIVSNMKINQNSNNKKFCTKLEKIIYDILKK